MPPDGVITVGTQVNTAPLVSGLAEAKAALKSAVASMKEAQAALSAQGVGAEQAAKIMAEYRAQVDAAEAALKKFAGTATTASSAISISIPAIRWSKQALDEHTASSMAASAELRVLEG